MSVVLIECSSLTDKIIRCVKRYLQYSIEKQFIIILFLSIIASTSPAQFRFSGGYEMSISRLYLHQAKPQTVHDKSQPDEPEAEYWQGFSFSIGYKLKNNLSFDFSCHPSFPVNPPDTSYVYGRWGISYTVSNEEKADFTIPLLLSVKYHFKTKSIKPFLGLAAGMDVEKRTFTTMITWEDSLPQTEQRSEFSRFFRCGADVGMEWYFYHGLGLAAALQPMFITNAQESGFNAAATIGLVFLLDSKVH